MPFIGNHIVRTLDEYYTEHGYEPAKKLIRTGDEHDPWRILIAIILSAGVRDKNVEMALPGLFENYNTPKDLAYAKQFHVEQLIHSTGYFSQKAKSIISTSRDIVERYDGKVPDSLEELTTLRGVGRKTANAVLSIVYEIPGIVVDTHVIRVTNRLGLVDIRDPYEIEMTLQTRITMSYWRRASYYLVFLGRDFCEARKPDCAACPVEHLCKKRI